MNNSIDSISSNPSSSFVANPVNISQMSSSLSTELSSAKDKLQEMVKSGEISPQLAKTLQECIDTLCLLVEEGLDGAGPLGQKAAQSIKDNLIDQIISMLSAPDTEDQTQDADAGVGSHDMPTMNPTPQASAAGYSGPSKSKGPSIKTGAPAGFLWKPVADSGGKLVILLPSKFKSKVKSLEILSPDGTQSLARGKFSGVGNGDREHYRFDKQGREFPVGSIVDATLRDGSHLRVTIKVPSIRNE